MNEFFLIAVLIVTVCQCQVIDPFAEISRSKNTVNSVSNDLKNFTNNLISDTTKKLNLLKINEMGLVIAIANNALDDIRNDIAAAKKQLKDADHCLEPTRLQLFNISMDAFPKFDKCLEYQLASLNATKDTIDAHIESREYPLSELDGISVSCTSGNRTQAQLCVAQKIPGASELVSSYVETAKKLKSAVESISKSDLASMTRCIQWEINDSHNVTSEVKISANKCIQNSSDSIAVRS